MSTVSVTSVILRIKNALKYLLGGILIFIYFIALLALFLLGRNMLIHFADF